jgi:hypothetical protein
MSDPIGTETVLKERYFGPEWRVRLRRLVNGPINYDGFVREGKWIQFRVSFEQKEDGKWPEFMCESMSNFDEDKQQEDVARYNQYCQDAPKQIAWWEKHYPPGQPLKVIGFKEVHNLRQQEQDDDDSE